MHFNTRVIMLTLTQTFALTENHFFNVCECMCVCIYIYSACISDSVEKTGFISSVSLLIDLLTLYIRKASCIVIDHKKTLWPIK